MSDDWRNSYDAWKTQSGYADSPQSEEALDEEAHWEMRHTMKIEDAVAAIIGPDLAKSIITDKGIHWAVYAAMAEARDNDNPHALEAIDRWNYAQKEPRS